MSTLYFAIKLYIHLRWIFIKHKVPFKYVREELIAYLNEIDMYFEEPRYNYSYIVYRVENHFLPLMQEKQIIKNNAFYDKMDKLIK